MYEEKKRWLTLKKAGIAAIVLIFMVVVLGIAVNYESRKHSDNIYRQTSVADKGKTGKKTTGQVKQQTKEKVPLEKSGTNQTKPKDTGQVTETAAVVTDTPEPKVTEQPTATAEAVIQVAAEKKADKKDTKQVTVKVIQHTEAYDMPTHIEGYQKVADVPQGAILTNVKQAGWGWLKGVYKDRELCIYYDSTDYDVSNEKTVYNKSIQGVTGRAKTELILREGPIVTSNVATESKIGKDSSLTILYYAHTKTRSGQFEDWYLVESNSTKSHSGWVVKENVSLDMVSDDKNPVTTVATSIPETETTVQPTAEIVTSSPETETTVQPTATPVVVTSTPESMEQPTAIPVVNTPKPKATEKPKQKVSVKTTKTISMYEEADDKAKVVCTIQEGEKIKKVEEAAIGKGWLHGETVDGKKGFFHYLYTDYAEKTNRKAKTVKKYKKSTYGIVSGEGVNFRVAPGTTKEIVDCLPKGNKLEIISQKELITGEEFGWCKVINLDTGEEAFMYAQYVKEVSTLERKKDNIEEQDNDITRPQKQQKQEKEKQSEKEKVAQSKKEEIVISKDLDQLQNDRKEIDSQEKESTKKKVTSKKPTKKKEDNKSKKKKSSSKATVKEMQAYAKEICKKYGWGNDEFKDLVTLWQRESGWNPNSIYNGCYGIPQRKDLASRPVTEEFKKDWKVQIRWGCEYIKLRYGKPSVALAHSNRTNWY